MYATAFAFQLGSGSLAVGLRDGSVHPRYAEAWRRVLSLTPEEISERLADPGETMCALRQSSPFAGALAPRERWQILRRARYAENRDPL